MQVAAANLARCLLEKSFMRNEHVSARSNGDSSDASKIDTRNPHAIAGVKEMFRKFASCTAGAVGSPWAFLVATLIVIGWAVTGPTFKYSDTWQLVINTGTTIVTFLMVFLIQNTQNRDARAMHLKLDELIRSIHGARNKLVDLESLSDEELDQLQKEFQRVRGRATDQPKASEALEQAQDHVELEQKRRDSAWRGSEDRSPTT
jgi:low affinity Fe/Cu permease